MCKISELCAPANIHLVMLLAYGEVAAASKAFSYIFCLLSSFCLQQYLITRYPAAQGLICYMCIDFVQPDTLSST